MVERLAKLIKQDGQGFINRGDGWEPLSPSDYARQQIYQDHVQGQSSGTRAITAAGKYYSDLMSGASQLAGGPQNAQDEQQNRADLQQRYQSQADYGGVAEKAGGFLAPAASAAIPGGLVVQTVIGAAQGALESPDSPLRGGLIGAGTTIGSDWAANAIGRI